MMILILFFLSICKAGYSPFTASTPLTFNSLTGNLTLANPLGVTYGGTGTSTQFTQGSVIFAGSSGIYTQDNANFFWNDSTDRLGIRTSSPSAVFDVHESGNSVPLIQAVNVGSQSSTGGGNVLTVHDSGAAMTSGNRLGVFQFAGAKNASSSFSIGATIQGLSTEAWSATANGSSMEFYTTPNTTTTLTRALLLDQDQSATFASGVNGNFFNATTLYKIGGSPFLSAQGSIYNVIIGLSQPTSVTGTANVTVGNGAGQSLTSGGSNVYVGYYAGHSNQTLTNNVGVGNGALSNNSTGGGNNSAVGSNALVQDTSGAYNVAHGSSAGANIRAGSYNTAVGGVALNTNQSGDGNTAVGLNSLFNVTSGYNVGLGYNSGLTCASGANNIIIGSTADCTASSTTNAIAIGYGATAASNKVTIGNSSITDNKFWGTISNLTDPSSAQQAATKNYVDTHSPSGTVCGWYDSVAPALIVNCQGNNPNTACPTGYTQKTTTGAVFCAAN